MECMLGGIQCSIDYPVNQSMTSSVSVYPNTHARCSFPSSSSHWAPCCLHGNRLQRGGLDRTRPLQHASHTQQQCVSVTAAAAARQNRVHLNASRLQLHCVFDLWTSRQFLSCFALFTFLGFKCILIVFLRCFGLNFEFWTIFDKLVGRWSYASSLLLVSVLS